MFHIDLYGRKHRRVLCLLALLGACLPGTVSSQVTTAVQSAPRRLLVFYRNNAIPTDAETRTTRAGGRLLHRHERFGTALVTGTAASEQALRNDPSVEYVVEDRVVTASSLSVRAIAPESTGKITLRPNTPHLAIPSETVSDAFYNGSPQGWAVRTIGGYGGGIAGSTSSGPWATTTGTGVRIAILDSGVDTAHPDIAPNLLMNLSEIDHNAQPSPCDDGTPQDQSGHGTWVASLAAAAAGPTTGQTVGIAPTASLLNIKVLQRMPGAGATITAQCTAGQASGLLSWVLQGIEDALNQNADIIVLSMSVTLDLTSGADAGLKASFDRVTHAASTAGATLIAAAGNDAFDFSNTRYVSIPAQSRDVLAVVASTNPDCAENLTTGATCTPGPPALAYYSNRGAPLNAVAAPGGSYPAGPDTSFSGWVRGACSNGTAGTVDGPPDANHSEGCFNLGHTQYVQAIGTSASAPLVAGIAALVRAAHPTWDAATVIAAIRASATATATATATMPYGVVNASAALAYKPQ
jgi:subtilisin family serine protease